MLESPFRITFDTNPDDCNLHCDMCEGHSEQYGNARTGSEKRRMPVSTIEKVLEDLKDNPPKEIIPSTMGEPLLYSDFEKKLALCRIYEIKLNLTTNGTFPRGGVEYWAKKLLLSCSDIKISFNGVSKTTHETIMRGSCFDQIVGNIQYLVELRHQLRQSGHECSTLTLQPTFREKNLREIPSIVSFALNLGLERVKGHHLWVHGENMASESLLRSPESRMRWNGVAKLCAMIASSSQMFGRIIRLVNFETVPIDDNSDCEPADWICPFLGREMWINTQGRFDVCCAPDDKRRTLGSFGNVLESNVLDLWHSREYSELCKNYMSCDVCKNCLLRRKEA